MPHSDAMPTQSKPVYTKDLRWKGGCLLAFLGPLFVMLGLTAGVVLMKLLGGSLHRFDWTGLSLVAAVILGVVGASLLGIHLGLRKSRGVRQLVQRRCESLYGIDLTDAIHVGISPGWATRSYDGDVDWDVGFLVLEHGRVIYYGDRTSFALHPEQIAGVEVSSYSDTVLVQYPRIDLVWQAYPKLGHEALGIDLRGARSVSELWVKALDLSTELEVLQERHPEAGRSSTGTQHLPPTTFDVQGLDRSQDRLSAVERCFLVAAHFAAWVPMWPVYMHRVKSVWVCAVAFTSTALLMKLVRDISVHLAKRQERRFMQRWSIAPEACHQSGLSAGR